MSKIKIQDVVPKGMRSDQAYQVTTIQYGQESQIQYGQESQIMEATQSNNSNQRVKQVTKKHVTDTSILADSSKHIEQNTLYCQNSLTTNKLKVMQHDKEFISPCGGRLSSNATNPMISKNRTKFSKNSI